MWSVDFLILVFLVQLEVAAVEEEEAGKYKELEQALDKG
jgi:hypothetical protein